MTNKRKTANWREKVKCLLCQKEINSDNQKKHKDKMHKNDSRCKFAIVTNSKQLKLTNISTNAASSSTSVSHNKGKMCNFNTIE